MNALRPMRCDNCGGENILPIVSGKQFLLRDHHLWAQGKVIVVSSMRFGLDKPSWGCGDCSEFHGAPGAPFDDDDVRVYRTAVEEAIAGYSSSSKADFARHVQRVALFDMLDEIAPLASTYFRVYVSATGAVVTTSSGEVVAT